MVLIWDKAMLQFKQKKPHPSLRDFIHGYWLIESDAAYERLELVPDGYPEIFFTLNGNIQIFSEKNHWQCFDQAGLIGQVTHRFAFETRDYSKVLYVKLYPWTPYSLFKIPFWQMNDAVVGIHDVTPDTRFRELSERVYAAENVDRATTILDAFFIQRLLPSQIENPFLHFAVRQIFSSNGTVGIDTLTQQIHASRRYVEKLFKQEIGMTPKQYARLIRVKKASMLLLDPQFSGQINSIIGPLDYYDQSHFLKDFKAVVQQTPTEFLGSQLNLSADCLKAYLQQWDYS
jgi:AraC-like DNA-binding protein